MTDDLHALFERLHGEDAADAERAAREVGEAARAEGARVVCVSACLLGEPTRYDATARSRPEAVAGFCRGERLRILPLCPEVLGGMGCPRPPVRFEGDRAVDPDGRDRTDALRRGAERADRLATLAGASAALLKERSPSCGVHAVHGAAGPQPGRGLFAERLVRRGAEVVSEEDVIKV